MAEYGHAHRKLRQRWARLVADGEVNCARCRLPIHPGQPWDLGHRDDDSGEYQGPEHRRCNRTAGGWKRWRPDSAMTAKRGKPRASSFTTHRRWWESRGSEESDALTNYLVCGPPCAGKTTWIAEHAPPDATVICYDTIAAQLGHRGQGRPPFKLGRAAEAEVQRQLARLERGEITGAYVIRTMAGAARRDELAARIRATIVLLVPDRDELMRRAAQRHDPRTTARDIDKWFDRERQGAGGIPPPHPGGA